jgi:DNA-binding transcriptional regulator LsrR (DeoR family)
MDKGNERDDQKLEEIARVHWEDMSFYKRHNNHTAAWLRARQLNYSDRQVGEALHTWEATRHRVFHSVLGKSMIKDPPPRCFALEQRLIEHYPTLRHATVVRADWLKELPATMYTVEVDSELHQGLGAWGGNGLLAYLRAGDHLGVGSGRGPFYAANALMDLGKTAGYGPATNVPFVSSLTGYMSRMYLEPEHHDADDIAAQLRGYFGTSAFSTNTSLIPTAATEHVRSKHLEKRPWSKLRPNVALVGIGALAPGHRLYNATADLAPAKEALDAIKKFADEIEKKYAAGVIGFRAVGDICNRFFTVRPPGLKKSIPRKIAADFGKLQAAIDKFNKQIYAVTFEQVRQIALEGTVIAVAGGMYKKFVIRHILNGVVKDNQRNDRRRMITHLVTDSVTGEWLCTPNSGDPVSRSAPE